MTTEAIPVSEPEPEPVPARKPRRKKGGIIAVSVIVGVLLLLVIGFLLAENWARQQIDSYVTEKVQSLLQLEDSHPVEVQVAGISVIAQAITGSLDQVDVAVNNVTVGELSGNVALTATDIPLDASKPVGSVSITLAVNEKSVEALVQQFGEGIADTVELSGSEIQFSKEFKIFGFPLTVGIAVEPVATDGAIGFTPTSLDLNGVELSVKELKDRFGKLANNLLATRSVCVAQYLPASLTLEHVAVEDDHLSVTIGAKDALFTEEALSTLGSCDAP